MKLVVNKDLQTLRNIITSYYDSYNIINNSKVLEDTVFIVVEKFFFRNSSRASLSIVMVAIDEFSTRIEAVGSGGGQGMIFKFDWGAKEAFEHAIPKILTQEGITFKEVT
ncbi:MAG: DUF6054 family protein [Candidatus Izemoplasmataceae bacterium]